MTKADLIIKNAAVYSVKLNDEEIHAEAMAVADGKIQYVGSESEAMKFAGKTTEIIDAKGASVLPGFGDDHTHVEGTVSKTFPTVNGYIPTPDDTPDTIVEKYKEILKKAVDDNPDMEYYLAIGWDQAYFNGSIKGIVKILSRKDLDEICPDKPMIVTSYCGHATWVNTKALERAGWARCDCPDAVGGIIYREPDGHPTGHLTEPAVSGKLSRDGGFIINEEMNTRGYKLYQEKFGSNKGITMACDMKSSRIGINAIKKMAENGETTMRYSFTYYMDPGSPEETYQAALDNVAKDQIEGLVSVNTLKFFIEGIYSFVEPYKDSWCDDNGYPRGYHGDLLWDLDKMYRYMSEGVEHGFNIHIHALASNAVLQAAKLCAKCRQAHPDKNVTYTIAHHMCITDEALKLMADNGIIASLQPYWMFYGNDVENNFPPMQDEPKYGWFPNKAYEDAGVPVAYGSDFPVTNPADPILGIGMALTRTVCPGNKEYNGYKGTVYREDQRVTLKQAVKASTAAVAKQFGWYDFTGTLEEGKSADFVILDRNIEKTSPGEIFDIKVSSTYFMGKKVF